MTAPGNFTSGAPKARPVTLATRSASASATMTTPSSTGYAAPRQFRQSLGEYARTAGGQRKFHVDRRRGVLLVFNLGLGKSGPAVDTPVDRLLPLVDHPLLDETAERPDDRGLVRGFQRQVGIGPQPESAQTLE